MRLGYDRKTDEREQVAKHTGDHKMSSQHAEALSPTAELDVMSLGTWVCCFREHMLFQGLQSPDSLVRLLCTNLTLLRPSSRYIQPSPRDDLWRAILFTSSKPTFCVALVAFQRKFLLAPIRLHEVSCTPVLPINLDGETRHRIAGALNQLHIALAIITNNCYGAIFLDDSPAILLIFPNCDPSTSQHG